MTQIQDPRLAETNTSGQGEASQFPKELSGWSWGGFLLGPIWGPCNGTYFALFMFVPVFGFIVQFMLGLKGREYAWRNKRWESEEDFLDTQRSWAIAGLSLHGALIVIALTGYIRSFSSSKAALAVKSAPTVTPAVARTEAPAAAPARPTATTQNGSMDVELPAGFRQRPTNADDLDLFNDATGGNVVVKWLSTKNYTNPQTGQPYTPESLQGVLEQQLAANDGCAFQPRDFDLGGGLVARGDLARCSRQPQAKSYEVLLVHKQVLGVDALFVAIDATEAGLTVAASARPHPGSVLPPAIAAPIGSPPVAASPASAPPDVLPAALSGSPAAACRTYLSRYAYVDPSDMQRCRAANAYSAQTLDVYTRIYKGSLGSDLMQTILAIRNKEQAECAIQIANKFRGSMTAKYLAATCL